MTLAWTHVTDDPSTLPKVGIPVIALLRNSRGKTRRVRAAYAAPKSLPLAFDAEDDAGEYDDATDTYYVSSGWYETNEYESTHWKVSDPVLAWISLPAPPEGFELEEFA